jgi:polyhydroxyalkanoate synthesis regulator phasin
MYFLAEEKKSGAAEAGLKNKLQMMMTTMYTMREAMKNLNDDCNILKTNITKLSNMTRY